MPDLPMFEQPSNSRAPLARLAASVVSHACLILALALQGHSKAVRVKLPGSALGSHVDLTYLPGRAPQPTVTAHVQIKPAPSATAIVRRPIPAIEAEPSPTALIAPARLEPAPAVDSTAQVNHAVAPSPSSTTGTDAQGEGNIQIALTSYAPDPEPDLSQLPRGTQGDVIVDVTIDPAGKVSDLQILHALGYGIEDDVVHTVRSWVFHPATRDGMPISSVQELHFHFARS
jgi:periplasmic protein TonB